MYEFLAQDASGRCGQALQLMLGSSQDVETEISYYVAQDFLTSAYS